MAKDVKEILKILFPEYQIKACIEERGFIAKKQVQKAPEVYAPMPKAVGKTDTPVKADTKTVNASKDAFENLPMELKKCWIGSERDRDALCKAFQRPYVKGFDHKIPRNAVLIIGSESRGRVYAVRCISELLKQKNVFQYAEIASIDMMDYASDSADGLFLSDLFKALNTNTESVVFENMEKASPLQLDIIYQLLMEGAYRLSKRYMVSNGGLVEATGMLNTELISEIGANGKFFVFTTSMPQAKMISILGNKIVKELGDIITLDPIADDQVKDLAYALCMNLEDKCKKNLHIEVKFDDLLMDAVGKRYHRSSGVRGLEEYMDDQLYETLSEMKLQKILQDGESINFTYEDGYYVVLNNGERIRTSQYLKNYNAAELEETREELNRIIGLTKVKEYILNLETNYKVQQMRTDKGLKKSDISMHMIFAGNPGTGKTTVARIVAKYLKATGILSSGHLCEVTRADLVGQYAGHTAVKTTDVIKRAIGGVLFIDEAYALCRDKNDSFGLEAIDALVKGMEDHRGDLVVILAGYEDEMQGFLKVNPGLQSRFPNVVHFEDYTVDEMYEIAKVTAASKGYRLSDGCEEGLRHEFERRQVKGKNDGGNGRLVRNLIEAAVLSQSQRIVKNSEDDLELLIADDFGLDQMDQEAEFDLEKRFSEIIGMDEVKEFIRTQYTMIQANKKRKKANIDVDTKQSLHMIFAGNPGTGKTTMARVVADMFKSMGVLKTGQLVETDKAGLIAEYVGQTAKKTEDIFKSAIGGVLFIDEAYALTNGGSSFGQECVDMLVKLIEEYKGEIVVILAGYRKEMNDFLKSNSGLESRFPLRIDFPDYSAVEMYEIGRRMIASRGFTLSEGADKILEEEMVRLKKQANVSSGNGRMVRNFIEEIIRRQSTRIAENDVAGNELALILPTDIRQQSASVKDFDLEKELSKVVGLDSVKKYIRSLNARLKLQAERKKAGLKTDNTQTMHMIFAGNPGTGKTMMARTIADVLYHMNVISSNKLIETDRSGLVAGYVGQTAMKTRQMIETALDGVLFIDEAYALAQGGENDFGKEAIDTLVKVMDDNRDRLVVILAGYSDDMKKFLDKNAGLQSRFANIIEFPDYSTDELMMIADGLYREQGYVLSEGARVAFIEKIEAARMDKQFGNGRYVRNIFERSLNNQALRLSGEKEYTKEILTVITERDIREA